MSASPVFTAAASGRPFVLPFLGGALPARFGAMPKLAAMPRLTGVTPASRLEVRPAPEMASSGIPELDALTGGLPRGCLTEICGTPSSGRTGILLAALAAATERGEACALVDASDALDPASAVAAGIAMERLLWVRCGKRNSPQRHRDTEKTRFLDPEHETNSHVKNVRLHNFGRNSAAHLNFGGAVGQRCATQNQGRQRLVSGHHFGDDARRFTITPSGTASENEADQKRWKASQQRLEQVLKITDLLLQSNGFGLIAIDLADIPAGSARRIPLASWFRFRRAVERTSTVLLVIEQQPIAGSCSSVLVKVAGRRGQIAGDRLQVTGEGSRGTGKDLAGGGPQASRQPSAISRQLWAESRQPWADSVELLDRFEITAELLRSRLDRKSSQSVMNFGARARWA